MQSFRLLRNPSSSMACDMETSRDTGKATVNILWCTCKKYGIGISSPLFVMYVMYVSVCQCRMKKYIYCNCTPLQYIFHMFYPPKNPACNTQKVTPWSVRSAHGCKFFFFGLTTHSTSLYQVLSALPYCLLLNDWIAPWLNLHNVGTNCSVVEYKIWECLEQL